MEVGTKKGNWNTGIKWSGSRLEKELIANPSNKSEFLIAITEHPSFPLESLAIYIFLKEFNRKRSCQIQQPEGFPCCLIPLCFVTIA